MVVVFQAIFSWANLPMNLIDQIFGALRAAARTHLPPGILTDLITDGGIAGVSSVLVFVPQIFLLFLFISLLEDSGYKARAAFLMDRLMRCFGLHGKSIHAAVEQFLMCCSRNHGHAHNREPEGSAGYNPDCSVHELFSAFAYLHLDDRDTVCGKEGVQYYFDRRVGDSGNVLVGNCDRTPCSFNFESHNSQVTGDGFCYGAAAISPADLAERGARYHDERGQLSETSRHSNSCHFDPALGADSFSSSFNPELRSSSEQSRCRRIRNDTG